MGYRARKIPCRSKPFHCGTKQLGREALLFALAGKDVPVSNTVLTVVGTNIPLNKVQANCLARMAATCPAPRAIRPAHLLYDGDIVFVLAARTPPPTVTGPGRKACWAVWGPRLWSAPPRTR
ncbi:P1 family peptidase [uncultured Desulfovibrio sp.]|uniref:P1 family peptidase n=1 Tax=uncultured Desulfovibrio sp. TaxID=167968 RepID=UPI00345BAAA0